MVVDGEHQNGVRVSHGIVQEEEGNIGEHIGHHDFNWVPLSRVHVGPSKYVVIINHKLSSKSFLVAEETNIDLGRGLALWILILIHDI